MISKTVTDLLEAADISIDGSRPWDIQVHDPRWFGRVIKEKNVGLGESYMEHWWDCEQIDEMIAHVLKAHLDRKVKGDFRYILRMLPCLLFNRQSRSRSRIIAQKHYDLGNDLFSSFLDERMQYSCGYFKDTDDLTQAQFNKLELIAHKLDLKPGDKLLDIGCGWGGLARHMAENYGCEVTAVNISQQQLAYARELCKGLPVTFVDQDYRSIEGQFDKIVSVGMFEHVGKRNYDAYMNTVYRCLKPDGIFLLHTIGSNISVGGVDPWIEHYIFPNGMLPSTAQIGQAAENLFVIEDWHNFGPYYDKTLMAWNDRFQEAWPKLADKYGDTFKRMWEYYLLSCAGCFRIRDIQLWQVVMTRDDGCRNQPFCRYC